MENENTSKIVSESLYEKRDQFMISIRKQQRLDIINNAREKRKIIDTIPGPSELDVNNVIGDNHDLAIQEKESSWGH